MEEKIIYWANTAKTKFTSDGLIKFNRIFKNNPTPTDEELSNIAKELESDTKTIREKFRGRHKYLKTRRTPTKKKVVITKAEKNINDDKQRSTTFLKNLNNRKAKLFMNYMINEDKCIDYINKHHAPKSININDIWKMTSDDHRNGSHLCDTNCCVLSEHLVIESFDVNLSRIRCQGVTLLVRLGNETSAGRIIQSSPCPHAISMRKMTVSKTVVEN
ncbi:unnamed protein product [Adineta steineri]|uniref:Zinc-binding loop region of homing endonuclease domain-containing protein n=1 Tax=Adineta steineri TaxID=433720 RepID=A0A815NIA2_9BILA|nr:unnamed protein product [Adineta steineri]CAF1471293.1 unnamed protein product [Adineta steineri]CAF3557680.1 unnamed protein product [Adineta steineri]CAF4137908.1 unnamed protein product [Adineta steineri]